MLGEIIMGGCGADAAYELLFWIRCCHHEPEYGHAQELLRRGRVEGSSQDPVLVAVPGHWAISSM